MKRPQALIKRTCRYFCYTVAIGLALLTISYLTPRKWGNTLQSGACTSQVYVSGGAFHTNIIVPVHNQHFDWRNHLPLHEFGNVASYRYLKFGWGDRDFYMNTPSWAEMRLTSALDALLSPGAAAMHVEASVSFPHESQVEVKCLQLDAVNYQKLMEFIDQSFEVNPQGKKIKIGDTNLRDRSFFAGRGKYSILRTCNSWTAEGLRVANINTPLWGGLAPAIMHHLHSGCECDPSGKPST